MGMSASQARLLSLTARQHDVEWRAQRLQAEKLQMANESDRVYINYLNELNAKKVQYCSLNDDGTTTFRDANLSILENGAVPNYTGEVSDTTYLVQNIADNKIFVTPEFANAYGIKAGNAATIPSIDEFLKQAGCTQIETMTDTIDYSNVLSATPVQNKLISSPSTYTVNDADTYVLTGSLQIPIDSSTAANISYTAAGSITAGTVTDPVENTKPVIVGGTPVNALSSSTNTQNIVTNSTYTINPNQTFSKLQSTEYNIPTEDLQLTMQQLSDKYGWNFDFEDKKDTLDLNRLNIYYGSGIDTRVYPTYNTGTYVSYAANTTLEEILLQVQQKSNGLVNYDTNNGRLTSSENLYFISSDDSDVDCIFSDYLANNKTNHYETAKQTVSLDTKIADFAYSDLTSNDSISSLGFYYGYSSLIKAQNLETNQSETSPNYTGNISLDNITFRDYFEFLKENWEGFDYSQDTDGNITLTKDGSSIYSAFSHHYKLGNKEVWYGLKGTENPEYKTLETEKITINTKAVAENIYLAGAILGETKQEEYNNNHTSEVNNINTKLNTIYATNKMELALVADTLNSAMAKYNNTGDITDLQNVYTNINNVFTQNNANAWNLDTSKYQTTSTTNPDGTTSTKQYDFVLTSSNVTVVPNTQNVPDGTTTPGKISNASSNEDIMEYIAYAMFNADNSSNYEQYLAQIQIKNFNATQLVSLASYKDSAEWNNIINKLIQGQDVSAYTSKYASYQVSQKTNNDFSVTNNSQPASFNVSVANPDDILDKLAFDVYKTRGETGNPNDIKNLLGNTFTNEQLASLSFYAKSEQWNDIVNTIAQGNYNLNTYTNKYSGYNIQYNNTDNVKINTKKNSHEEKILGNIQIPEVEQIASNVIAALRMKGYNIDENQVKTLLTNKYGNNNANSNKILADINEAVCKYILNGNNSNQIDNIYSHLFNNSALNITQTYSLSDYNITRNNLGNCSVNYGTKQVGTGNYEWKKDQTYENAIEKYNALKQLQGFEFVVVTSEQAKSQEFLNNYIIENHAILLKFDASEKEMQKTNIAVELPLQETADTENLKKAEAKYEADIKKINRKETKIDTELQQLEAERSSIKTEQDDLKTVINDNVSLTFKLFS